MNRFPRVSKSRAAALVAILAIAVAIPVGLGIAAATSTGLLVYTSSTSLTYGRVRTYSPSVFSAQGNQANGGIPRFMVLRASPTRANEYISAYVDSANTLRVFRYDGSTWTQDWTVAISSSSNFRRFDVAYEGTNGRAVVAYGTSTTEQVAFRTYDGTSWTSAVNYSMANLNSGTITWLKLAPNPVSGSNQIALTASDSGNGLATAFWDATLNAGAGGFGTSTQHTTSLARSSVAGDLECFDQTYESLSGDLMVAYEVDASTPFWRAYQGGAWGTATALGGTALEGQMSTASDPASDRIVVAFNRTGNGGVYSYIWNGTSTMTANSAQTNGYASVTTAMRPIETFWAVAGGVSHAYVFYTSSTSYQLRYLRYNASTSTWTNTGSYTSAGPVSGVSIYWISAERDPLGSDVVMLTYSDSGSDLWARQITAASAGTLTFADPNPSAGTALATSSSGTGYENFAFAYNRYSVRTTIASGSDPTGLPPYVAPGSAVQEVDDFTVQTDTGSDSITAVQVTLATGTWQGVGLIEITDASVPPVTVYGSAAPTADANDITLSTNITSSTTLTHYKIRITPAAATAMPAPQGSVLNVTARISDITVTNAKSVTDSSSTLVIDNASSPNVGTPTTTGGIGSVTTSWPSLGAGTAPADDFSGTVLVLGNDTQAVAGSPTEGVTSYNVGDPVGSDTVVCFGAITSCQKTGLGSADAYYFEIFTLDGVGNWSSGVATSGTSSSVPLTTIGTGTDPTVGAAYVAPGTGAVVVDAFTVQRTDPPPGGWTETITAVEVTFAAGTAQGIGLVEIVNDAENTVYGSASNPADVQSFTLTTTISSTTASTQYKIRVTPRSHANMPVPPGGPYSVTARISNVTVTYAESLNDTVGASATLNIDNQSAPDVTGASASASGDTVTATWTNPAAGAPPNDFASVIVVGSTASISGAPTEGQTVYGVGNPVGSGTVLCIDPAGQTCSRNGLSAGQVYYMRIFTRDALGNWSSGVSVSATVPNNQTVAGAFTADLVDCGHVVQQANYTGDFDDDNTVTFRRGTEAAGPFSTTVCTSVGGGTNPRTCTDATSLTPGSTFYYEATFTDPDNTPTTIAVISGAVAIPSGCTPVQPGNTAGANIPVLSIINPSAGAVIGSTAGGFRAQVRVFSRDASAIAGLNLSTDGSNPSCTAASLNGFSQTAHVAGNNAWVYEKTITLASSGTYLLRACARNGAGEARSEAVTIRYNSANAGDGSLLVRDNSSQLCNDCHAVKSHSSETTSSTYGSWSTACRDCHQPHSTRNLKLVAEQINTPTVDTYLGPVAVEFRDKDTGDSGTSETISFVTSDATKLAAGRRGPCQACHTRTLSRAQMTGGNFTPSSTSVTASGTFVSGDVGKYILGPDGKSYQITAFVSGTQVTISPAYAGSTPVSNYTFQWGLRRWRNAGNADGHYTAAASTSMCTTCHSHTEGFGSTTICLNCHGTTGGDVNELAEGFWQSNTMAKIDTAEWTYSGHGRASGTYDVTGNVAPNFSTSPAPGFTECLFCHSDTVAHRDGGNPFRLRGASTDATGDTGTYDGVNAPNSTCLNCHKTSSFGVNNGGGVKNGGVKVEESHNGTKHTSGTLGGKFCWDCHEPHGDRTASGGNIAMIRAKVLAVTDGTYGYLGASGVERTVTYTDQAGSSPAVGRAVEATNTPRTGICQACHGLSNETYWTKYWNRNGQDDPDGPGAIAAVASAHQAGSSATPYCISCHKHAKKFRGTGDCTACHDVAQSGGAVSRRAITAEFTTAGNWSHKRNGGYTVSKWDCIVCHMEGDASDTVDGDPSGVHGDTLIDLRNPDTGTTIESVSWGDPSATGAGLYQSSGVALPFQRFQRTLSTNVLEEPVKAIMINQCLACHDADGAGAYAPGLPLNALGTALGFTAGKPFGTTISAGQGTYTGGSGYTACSAGTDGCVTNINDSFATTNSSYHPIRGKQNNSYTASSRMASPWSMTKTPGSTAGWGYLMSCWDCHAPNGTPSTAVLTSTVTAHGGTTTLRGVPTVTGSPGTANKVTLCQNCHIGYEEASPSTNGHGTGSAITVSVDSGMNNYMKYGCNICHGAATDFSALTVGRPVRAQDVHGVNALPTNGATKTGRWSGASQGTPAQVETRPYAFIRNTQMLTNHTPKVIGGTTYSSTEIMCLMNVSPCGSNRNKTYTVGGTY